MDKVVLRTTFIDIRAKRTRFLSENNVSGRYRSDPPLLSLFRRYFLASPRTNAVCTTTLVTRDIDTRVVARPGRGGKRSPRCVWGGREGVESPIDPLSREYFFLSFPFLSFSIVRTPLPHSAPTFCPSSPLGFDFFLSPPFFFLLFVLFLVYFYVRVFVAKRETGVRNNEIYAI